MRKSSVSAGMQTENVPRFRRIFRSLTQLGRDRYPTTSVLSYGSTDERSVISDITL
jgi:hypothetical protein